MKIEATVNQIRLLLELAASDKGEDTLSPESRRRGEEAVRRGLPRVLLERYQAVSARRTPAIAAIETGICSGCHVLLPTMLASVARRAPAVHPCPHCRRLLYAPELLREESNARGSKPAPPATTASAALKPA